VSRSGQGHVRGPLAAYGEGFRESLLALGYRWGSAARQVQLMAHLSRWLDLQGLAPAGLTPEVVAQFLRTRRAEGYAGLLSARAMATPVGYLQAVGVVVSPPPAAVTQVDQLLVGFRRYLSQERGLAQASIRSYLRAARLFLDGVAVDGVLDVHRVTGAMVAQFVRCECSGRSVAWAKMTGTGLRSLLRYLYLDGQLPVLLTAAAPGVAGWQLAALPRAVNAGELSRLLLSCDQNTPLGRRDFAVLTVLARLGLRAAEVSGLDLADLDWRAGELTVRGKGLRRDRLPLPVDVGEAVAGWLQWGRPSGVASAAVFIRDRAPHARLAPSGVSELVRRACRRAGVPEFGPHRLRHTTATELLRAGAPLTEVGQVLRHSRQLTTAIYAKVDQSTLAGLAQAWPEPRP